MALTMRYSGNTPSIGGSGLARNYDRDSGRDSGRDCARNNGPDNGGEHSGLAAFRVHADLDYARSLSTLIENEIIPRMMVAHVKDPPTAPIVTPDTESIGRADVEALAPLALQVEADALLNHVETILARGVAVDTVMVDLLAPTARLLGDYWDEDRCDFVEVTMALWRLQEIVHEIAARFNRSDVSASLIRSVTHPSPRNNSSITTVPKLC